MDTGISTSFKFKIPSCYACLVNSTPTAGGVLNNSVNAISNIRFYPQLAAVCRGETKYGHRIAVTYKLVCLWPGVCGISTCVLTSDLGVIQRPRGSPSLSVVYPISLVMFLFNLQAVLHSPGACSVRRY